MPEKNFRLIGDTSLTEISIRICREAGVFDHILLTTDWLFGEDLAKTWEIAFHRRSPDAASETASASDVLKDIANTLLVAGIRDEDYLFYLQPSSPLRTVSMIRDSWAKLLECSYQGLVSVTEIDAKFRKTLVISGDVIEAHGHRDNLTSNQQSLSALYLANGNLFAFRWGLFVETGEFPIEGLHPVKESGEVTLDIDSEEDFENFRLRLH